MQPAKSLRANNSALLHPALNAASSSLGGAASRGNLIEKFDHIAEREREQQAAGSLAKRKRDHAESDGPVGARSLCCAEPLRVSFFS